MNNKLLLSLLFISSAEYGMERKNEQSLHLNSNKISTTQVAILNTERFQRYRDEKLFPVKGAVRAQIKPYKSPSAGGLPSISE